MRIAFSLLLGEAASFAVAGAHAAMIPRRMTTIRFGVTSPHVVGFGYTGGAQPQAGTFQYKANSRAQ